MRVRLVVAAAVDGVALAELVPAPAALRWATHHLATEPDRALVEFARAAAFVAAVWVALGLLLVVSAAVPGPLGVLADRAQRVVLPGVAQQLLAGAVGVGLVVTPAVASARTTPSTPPAPVWPAAATSSHQQPAAATPPSGPQGPTWPARATGPSITPAQPAPSADHDAVVVRAGDSLWSIAAAHLDGRATDGQIAAAWPAWWSANRAVVGTDPDVIRPGQALWSPTAGHRRPAHEAGTTTPAPTPDQSPRGPS